MNKLLFDACIGVIAVGIVYFVILMIVEAAKMLGSLALMCYLAFRVNKKNVLIVTLFTLVAAALIFVVVNHQIPLR